MKKMFLTAALAFFLVGCGNTNEPTQNAPAVSPEGATTTSHNHDHDADFEPLQVVATFSVIADMVYQVAGELVEIYTIVPIGEEPEEHEVLPSDMIAVSNAAIVFYNGIGLEDEGYWFEDLVEATGIEAGVTLFVVTEGITPLNLQTEGMEDYYDPHAWLDPRYGMIYIQNIADILSVFMPEHADTFQANATREIARLQQLFDQWVGTFDDIPASERIVFTTEGAFRYFANAFNLYVGYIWELNAEEEGTIEQMISIIELVNASDVRYLFIESSLEPDYMEQVSEETGVPIFGMLFTDSISYADGEAPTYFDMLRHNLESINTALRGL